MKKNILPIALASTLLVAACSPDSITSAGKDDSEKTPIEFSMTDNTGSVVAVNGNTRAGFTAETGIVMQMVATKNGSTSDTKTTKTSATAEQQATDKEFSNVSFGESSNANVRYWDDAYGRDTKLSIYAVAVPSKTNITALNNLGGTSTTTSDWSVSATNTLTWELTKENTTTTNIEEQDLVYSNNIQETATAYNNANGVYKYNFESQTYPAYGENNLIAGQMQFRLKSDDVADGPGKFDKGNLNFVHALSRVTIKVKYGSEFADGETFADPTLINMPYKGTLDVKTGTFSATTEGQSDADKSNVAMATASNTNDESIKKLCQGQVLPGYEISSSSDANFLSFKIGSNVYYVTQASVFKALNIEANTNSLNYKTNGDAKDENTIVMTQGKNYVLTITVSKTKIDNISATLADWTTIEGSTDRNNAYLNFTFSNYAENSSSKNFTLYRSKYTYDNPVTGTDYTANYDWDKGYSGNAATLTEPTSGSNVWKTAWYWDSNKDFYHFRMVGKGSGESATALEIKKEGSGDSEKEYFEIKSGDSDGNYRWGAPMAKSGDTDQTLTYNTTDGFDAVSNNTETNKHHISAAIGATNDNIHLTEVNTLAKIVVKLTTSDGADKVTFTDGDNKTTVELQNIYTEGKVYMGNGLVATTGNRSSGATKMTVPTDDTSGYTYFVVPQALVEGETDKTYVAFKITTPDGNVYYVKEKLSTIQATSNTIGTNSSNVSIGQKANETIDYWYPNCTYTYTFKLTKTGINNFTATLVPYTEITGDNTDINLED